MSNRYTAKNPAFDTVILDGSVFQDMKRKADAYPQIVSHIREVIEDYKYGLDPYTALRLSEILLRELGEL